MKAIVFEIWGDYGLFRKFYTTSSPLTFSFPPPTAIAGMIGAVLGLPRETYLEKINSSTFDAAVIPVNPLKKTRITINHIETKSAIEMSKIRERTQTRSEFLRDAKFRLYIYFKDDALRDEFRELLMNGKTHYTLCLGLSELIAGFRYLGEYEIHRIEGSAKKSVKCILITDRIETEGIDFEKGGKYIKERIPVSMKPDRSVDFYRTVLFNANADPIEVRARDLWSVGDGETIMFLGTLLSQGSEKTS
jgi:CRISPR-associated protein Cas5h